MKFVPFIYIGETKRTWKTRLLEHKSGVRKQNYSAVKDHEEITGHEVRSTDVEILERGVNNHQICLFLEAIHSVRTKDSVNEHIELPHVYLPLITSLGTWYSVNFQIFHEGDHGTEAWSRDI